MSEWNSILLLAGRLCNTIIERILPVIFSNIDVTKNRLKIETDDISLEFNKAIKAVKTHFDDFFEWLYSDIKVSDVEKLFDSDFDKGECNYGVLVCSVFHNIRYNLFIIEPTKKCTHSNSPPCN